MFLIQRFTNEQKEEWDDFVANAKNENFIFQRAYMDYHHDRFFDHSLVVRDINGKLIAILPANAVDKTLWSHQGLTYGGFLISDNMRTETMLGVFESVKKYLVAAGFDLLIYKSSPVVYHRQPCGEDLYALFISGAVLLRRDVSVAINLKHRIPYQQQRKRAIKKAQKFDVFVVEEQDFSVYWNLLLQVLSEKHQQKPTHSLSEIQLLHDRFPLNIRLFVATRNGHVIAGVVVYVSANVAHTQYLASSTEGRAVGALDAIIDYLINEVFQEKMYLNFGVSTEQQGRFLNTGLIAQKEGFGARAVVCDFYRWELKS